jgi:small subunit ribosomal protein S17
MRTKKGVVTSAKMQKTVVVTVTRLVMHPKYQKRYPVRKRFLADTGEQAVREGDTVLIGETRPLSKRKYFRVLKVLTKGMGVGDVSLEEELQEVRLGAAEPRRMGGERKGSEAGEGSDGSEGNGKETISKTSKTLHTLLPFRK